MSEARFYAVRLLWVLNPERFAEYQERDQTDFLYQP